MTPIRGLPEAIKALNIRYVLASGPTIRGFKVPEGLYFLDKSPYWTMIYDNGGAQIYEWHGRHAGTSIADTHEDGDWVEYRERRPRYR